LDWNNSVFNTRTSINDFLVSSEGNPKANFTGRLWVRLLKDYKKFQKCAIDSSPFF